MESGETPQQAIIRELKEELGLRVRIKRLFDFYPGIYPHRFDPCAVLSVVYIITPQGQPRVLDKRELQLFRWFAKKELPRHIAFDSNRRILKDFFKVWK